MIEVVVLGWPYQAAPVARMRVREDGSSYPTVATRSGHASSWAVLVRRAWEDAGSPMHLRGVRYAAEVTVLVPRPAKHLRRDGSVKPWAARIARPNASRNQRLSGIADHTLATLVRCGAVTAATCVVLAAGVEWASERGVRVRLVPVQTPEWTSEVGSAAQDRIGTR